jgi:hypothetical protein
MGERAAESEERAFARTVGAKQRPAFARMNGERDAIEECLAASNHIDSIQLQDRMPGCGWER